MCVVKYENFFYCIWSLLNLIAVCNEYIYIYYAVFTPGYDFI